MLSPVTVLSHLGAAPCHANSTPRWAKQLLCSHWFWIKQNLQTSLVNWRSSEWLCKLTSHTVPCSHHLASSRQHICMPKGLTWNGFLSFRMERNSVRTELLQVSNIANGEAYLARLNVRIVSKYSASEPVQFRSETFPCTSKYATDHWGGPTFFSS